MKLFYSGAMIPGGVVADYYMDEETATIRRTRPNGSKEILMLGKGSWTGWERERDN